jgi:TolB-like protein
MDVAAAGTGSPLVNADEFRIYLNGLLALPEFASSRRRGQLLRYLIERSLAGQADQLTEYGIALDVFEKPSSFDPRIEATVRVEMSRLRRALADHYQDAGAADAWRIQLPGRGYVPVIQPGSGAPAKVAVVPQAETGSVRTRPRRSRLRWSAMALAAIVLVAVFIVRYVMPTRTSFKSIAVLPFANLTGDARNDYLADGVTEQLTDSLAQISSLRVVARTSAFQFKGKGADIREIGRRLDADAVVEGSLRYLNGTIRLTVQVNRSADGYHILSRTFDGGMQELGRLESEVAPVVAAAMRPAAALTRHKTPDPPAYDLYLKARAYRGQGTRFAFEQAIVYLNQAIERDPGYADAYADLAGVYAAAAVNFATEPLLYTKKAKAAAATALQLDPASGPAYAAEGLVDALVLLDWNKGEHELRQGIRLMPQGLKIHSWLGVTLLYEGRFPEAISELKLTGDLDPLVPNVALGNAYYVAREYDTALHTLSRIRDLHPDLIAVHPFIGAVWEGKSEFEKAMAEYQLALPEMPDDVKPRLAHLLARMGRRSEALRILDALQHPKPDAPPASAYDVAVVYAALGDRNAAFEWLFRAYDQRTISFLKVDPLLDSLRSDPRYIELLKKSGLAN